MGDFSLSSTAKQQFSIKSESSGHKKHTHPLYKYNTFNIPRADMELF